MCYFCNTAVPNSVLFLGRPGVGKTTVIREMARVLADDLRKRVVRVHNSPHRAHMVKCGASLIVREGLQVDCAYSMSLQVIVDTSNEIGGDGDVPHPTIGGARRMQVPDPSQQHRVMVRASPFQCTANCCFIGCCARSTTGEPFLTPIS